MDLLYERYSRPFELLSLYMEQGRFGELVHEIIRQENARRRLQAKETENRLLWTAYLHSQSDKSFAQWKEGLLSGSRNRDNELTPADVEKIMERLFTEERR